MLDLPLLLLKYYLVINICDTNLATAYNAGVPDIGSIAS